MSFAATAAERGHRVVLYEAAPQLGGQLQMARTVPGKTEFDELLRYFGQRLADAQVDVRLNHMPQVDELAKGGFETVVIATGVRPRNLRIEGIGHPKVLDYRQVLLERRPVGRRVAIIGAGGIGFDMVEYLLGDEPHAPPGLQQFAVEYGHGFAAEPGYVHDWDINPRVDRQGRPIPPPVVADLATVISRPVVKLLAKDRGADADAFLESAESLIAGRASVTHSSSFGLLEIAAPGVTKASGLAELAASHGISAAEVVAIGDMPNDVPMLHWAGTSYAVANAHPAAIAAAGAVVGSNEDDAVAVLIESLLP